MSKTQKLESISCLVTGFGPFGKVKKNPSQLIAESMSGSLKTADGRTIEVETLVLPTCRKDSWKLLKRHLERKSPQMLIMTGVAAGRKKVSLERFALNIRDYSIEDISGNKPVGKAIRKSGPAAYQTMLPLVDLQRTLTKSSLSCDISNHAGSFVCNDLFYRALHHQTTADGPEVVQFVHVPALKAKPLHAKQVDKFVRTIAELIRLSAP